MSNTTQKYLRFIIPGMLGYFALYYVCRTCDFCSIGWPTKFDEVMKLTSVLLIAFLYEFSNLRKLSNGIPFFRVNAGIMQKLKGPFIEEDDRIKEINWDEFQDVYYPIIDNDETLKLRSENIRFNGTLWTSAADLRAVATIGLLVVALFFVVLRLGLYDGFFESELLKSALIFLAFVLISLPMSWVLTNRHREMVSRQCNYILLHKREDLEKGLKDIVRSR